MTAAALKAAAVLEEKGYSPSVVNARFIKPLDEDLLSRLSESHSLIVVLSENNRSGGLGEAVEDVVSRRQLRAEVLSLEPADGFLSQGKPDELRKALGLDPESIAEAAAGAAGCVRVRKKGFFQERFGKKK